MAIRRLGVRSSYENMLLSCYSKIEYVARQFSAVGQFSQFSSETGSSNVYVTDLRSTFGASRSPLFVRNLYLI